MNFFQKTSSLLLILLFLFSPLAPLFANDQLIAIIKGTGATAQVYQISTDHLTGSNVVTNSTGALEELMDYYPYGGIRLDEKAGSFSEQRKFAGHELDVDTGLSYMNARYYDSGMGRFVSLDPAYLAVGDNAKLKALTKLETERYLADPQLANSYSYVANNPLKYTDSTGDFLDIALDVGFIGYDLYRMGSAALRGNWSEVKSESANLGLDVGGAALPGVTGLGMIRRAGEAGKVADKAGDVGKIVEKMDPSKIRFAQDSISSTFRNGNTLEVTVNDLKSGKISPDNFPPIRIFEKNGNIFSLDNRRLQVFKEAGINIPTVKATTQELKNELVRKFTTFNEGKSIIIK
jgi:RHS repeat-associated protein